MPPTIPTALALSPHFPFALVRAPARHPPAFKHQLRTRLCLRLVSAPLRSSTGSAFVDPFCSRSFTDTSSAAALQLDDSAHVRLIAAFVLFDTGDRDIALNAHDFWQSLSLSNHRSSALLSMWLSRSGNSPPNYSIACDAAGALIDTSLQHSRRWEDMTLKLPFTSFLRLRFRTLPMLRRLAIGIHHIHFPDGVLAPDAIVIDAPLLRAIRIASPTWAIKFDLPWSQLTLVIVAYKMRIGECMDLLPKCPALVELTVSTEYDLPKNSPADTYPHPTLSALESLSVNSDALQFLTLPRLQVLSLTGDHSFRTPSALTSLVRRSSCTLQQLTFVLFNIRIELVPNIFPGLLLAVPHSVARFELQMGPREYILDDLLAALSTPVILPALKTLCIRSSVLFPSRLKALTNMLHAQRSAPSSLDSFDVQLNVSSVGWKPRHARLAALQVLVNDGLHIRIEVVCRVRSETTTVIESGENGLLWQ
ncbi:hypothetical protein C8J57DRAFT_1721712 [Mycena rebaudengoi]|nr:hypothetical protein C8J57DRAFT_1721712 [Mycena rebaudengoi]